MGSAGIQKTARVSGRNAASDLHSHRIGAQRRKRLLAVQLIHGGIRRGAVQKYDMSAGKPLLSVKIRVPGGIFCGYKILLRTAFGFRPGQRCIPVTKRTTDDLLHFPVMNINTRSDFHTHSNYMPPADYAGRCFMQEHPACHRGPQACPKGISQQRPPLFRKSRGCTLCGKRLQLRLLRRKSHRDPPESCLRG